MLLGDQIQYVLRLKKMERKEVAEKLGVSIQQYSKYENNESHIDQNKLERISQIFEIDYQKIIKIDTAKILNQINQESSILSDTIFEKNITNDTVLFVRLVDSQNRLLEILEKRLSTLEDFVKTKLLDK